ncbi:hypothetical protein D3C73_1015900 [compost metagenome]
MTADVGVRLVAGGKAGQVFSQRALGHDVDHAAHPAVGRNAVHQGTRPLEHFDTFGVLGKGAIVGRDAIHAVVGEFAQVAFADGKATDEEGVDDAAGLPGGAHRRIPLQGVGHGHRLQVGQGLGRVAGDAERRVHHILVAHHAQARTARYLATGELCRQRGGPGVAGVDVGGVQGQVRCLVRRTG